MTTNYAPQQLAGKKYILDKERRLYLHNVAYRSDQVFERLRYKHNPIMGEGATRQPRLIFVVGMPGLADEQAGKLLSGHESQVFYNMLRCVDLTRDQVYVTAAMKYHVPNRSLATLSADVRTACLKHLRKELKIIKPQVVVLLGRDISEALIPNCDLVHEHGWLCHSSSGHRSFVPMFHPSASLVNKDIARATLRDMSKLNVLLNSRNGRKSND